MATKKRGTLSAFAKSYNQARQAGDQEFMYGDKMYSTRQKGESATNYVNPNFDINQPRSFGYGTNVDFPTVKSGPRESDPLQHQIQEDLIAKRGDDVNEYRDWVDTQHTFDYVNKNMRWPNGTFDLTRRQQQVLNPMRSNFLPSKEFYENKKMGGRVGYQTGNTVNSNSSQAYTDSMNLHLRGLSNAEFFSTPRSIGRETSQHTDSLNQVYPVSPEGQKNIKPIGMVYQPLKRDVGDTDPGDTYMPSGMYKRPVGKKMGGPIARLKKKK